MELRILGIDTISVDVGRGKDGRWWADVYLKNRPDAVDWHQWGHYDDLNDAITAITEKLRMRPQEVEHMQENIPGNLYV